jgi:hypothetical protein
MRTSDLMLAAWTNFAKAASPNPPNHRPANHTAAAGQEKVGRIIYGNTYIGNYAKRFLKFFLLCYAITLIFEVCEFRCFLTY